MKKNLLSVFIVIIFSGSAFAQPAFNPVEKGNKQAGLQIMIAPTDMFWSETALNVSKDNKTYGLHLAGSYGWFVERGWMIGLQSNVGFYHNDYGGNAQWGVEENIFDISIAPMTRYYFNVDKKHRFKPFLFAGLPVVYNDVKRKYNDNSWSTDVDENYLELRGTFGFGAAYFGRAGSMELNLSNMGFFLGVNKFIQGRKK